IWDCVEVEYVATLPYLVSMERIRAEPALADMFLLRQGRLSVQPVTEAEYETIVALGEVAPPAPVKRPKPAKATKPAKAAKSAKAKKASNAVKPARAKRAKVRAAATRRAGARRS